MNHLKTFTAILLICTISHAFENDSGHTLSMLQKERITAHQEDMQKRIETKKEEIRTRLEEKGMGYDEIEAYLEKLFNRTQKTEPIKKP